MNFLFYSRLIYFVTFDFWWNVAAYFQLISDKNLMPVLFLIIIKFME